MNKYWQIFKISFQEEFAYRVNFIMWRIRNVFQIFLVFFLWDAVFSTPGRVIFGYDRAGILTYVFAIMIVKALVFSARAVDVSYDVANGDLSNYLVKPVSYFKYWFTRDVSSKTLNLLFAIGEFAILFLILKPPFYFQQDITAILAFLITLGVGVFIYFSLLFAVSAVSFWAPELSWGSQFLLIIVVIEFLSGSVFPLDIFPAIWQKMFLMTPFPYLIYFPIQVYLGKISGIPLIQGLFISGAWAAGLWIFTRYIWDRGLKVYQSIGR